MIAKPSPGFWECPLSPGIMGLLSGIGYFKKLSYQSATDIRSKTIFRLVYRRCITALETGIKLVSGWYYLEYLPDW